MDPKKKFKFSIDRGGTFTDIYCITPDGKIVTEKILSENPQCYSDAPTYAIKKILAQEMGTKIKEGPIDSFNIDYIRMGTTVATNALLESKGDRFCLLITKGFRDLLYIKNQSRPNLFDLSIEMSKTLYDDVIEVDERVIPYKEDIPGLNRIEVLPNNQKVEILKELDLKIIENDLRKLKNEKNIKNIAVMLMHSYLYNNHEITIGKLAKQLGFQNVSLSHEISPMIRSVPRGLTTTIDAYLTPSIDKYLQSFKASFSSNVNVLFMQSDGGLTSLENFRGCRAILSGPAGGVVGYALTSYNLSDKQPVIGFDMGGTSTDVSRYDGKYEHVFETITAGYTIQTPQLDINTIAAGGGSMLFFRSGMFYVGPESASSNPGPACYKKDGPLTITDANLVLGRLLPENFPKIFGKNQNEPLDLEISRKLFGELTLEINEYLKTKNLSEMCLEDVALGFVKVANEAMCRPIRNLTEGKGYDTRKHVLSVFGGAGGQHACAIARSLGIQKIYVNRFSGILSALGLSIADIVTEKQEPCNLALSQANLDTYVYDRIENLKEVCIAHLQSKENFTKDSIEIEIYLNLRYLGTDTGIMCSVLKPFSNLKELTCFDFEASMQKRFKDEYGFNLDRQIMIDDIRIRGIGKSKFFHEKFQLFERNAGTLKSLYTRNVYFSGKFLETQIYDIKDFMLNDSISGPAIIIDKNSTLLIEPNCIASTNSYGDILIKLDYNEANFKSPEKTNDLQLNTTQLSIFSHRFMSIAEQTGRILQRTAVSTNIKERLDYSCAMFDSNGGLVANAPHIPVHLGAMQEAVKFQIEYAKSCPLKNGDVLLSNHPACGGSHLPDLTVITPVFYGESIVFFVANRGHHSDIGGLTPGSMPPNSTKLWQEGAVFKSMKIVENNFFKENEIVEAFMAPSKFIGCSGSRNIKDNISDLKAQVAANNKGIELIKQLINEYKLDVVLAYMKHIQNTAEQSVRNLMKEISAKTNNDPTNKFVHLKDEEYMDDGSTIKLSVKINTEDGSASFDFTGTTYQVNGNSNAPRAITLSAIIYCLRCMLNYEIPLNQGCLKPVTVIIPENSLLSPSDDAAVVGGNVLTSQRIVDLIFKCFSVCSGSQGCMNNITFGNQKWGYYETVGGGAGAGPNWHGRHGVHSHMTNTRITDVEIFENRYPVMIGKFSLRKFSGGRGKYNGGDGLEREYIFREALKLCVLTERRVFRPYALFNGEKGARGINTFIKKNGLCINLGSKAEIDVEPGDRFLLQTPGGGGFGTALSDDSNETEKQKIYSFVEKGSLHNYQSIQNSA